MGTNLIIAFLIGHVCSFDVKSNIASKDLSSGVDVPSVSLIPLQLYSSLFVKGGADDTRQDAESCEDTMAIEKCIKRKNNGRCDKPNVIKKCMKTCGLCEQEEEGDDDDENHENDEDDIPDGDNEEEVEEDDNDDDDDD